MYAVHRQKLIEAGGKSGAEQTSMNAKNLVVYDD